MTWQERLVPNIVFVSPEGNQFTAFWRSSPRTKDKKVGIHEFPRVAGNVVQDLDANSDRYSLTFFFEGPDHDLEAQAFWAAFNERGPWDVLHPVHGFMQLQPLSITENDDVIDSGNMTEFNSEWIEPIDEVTLSTAREYAATVDNLSDEVNGTSAEQFDEEIMDFT
jgi:prophage DNA circulation protein